MDRHADCLALGVGQRSDDPSPTGRAWGRVLAVAEGKSAANGGLCTCGVEWRRRPDGMQPGTALWATAALFGGVLLNGNPTVACPARLPGVDRKRQGSLSPYLCRRAMGSIRPQHSVRRASALRSAHPCRQVPGTPSSPPACWFSLALHGLLYVVSRTSTSP